MHVINLCRRRKTEQKMLEQFSLEKCTTLIWRLTWFGSSKWNVLSPRHTLCMSAGEINSHHPRNGDGLGLFLKTVQNVLSKGMQSSNFFNSLEKIFTSVLFVLLHTRRRCLP